MADEVPEVLLVGACAGQAAALDAKEEAGLQQACTAAAYGVEAAEVLLRFCQHLGSARPGLLPEQVRHAWFCCRCVARVYV